MTSYSKIRLQVSVLRTNGPLVAIYSHGGHLGHVTWTIYINFRSPFLRMLHMKFGFDWPSGFREKEIVNDGRWTKDDGRTTEHGYTISSPVSLRLR